MRLSRTSAGGSVVTAGQERRRVSTQLPSLCTLTGHVSEHWTDEGKNSNERIRKYRGGTLCNIHNVCFCFSHSLQKYVWAV